MTGTPRETWFSAVGSLLVVAVVGLAFSSAGVMAGVTCGGDGGSPYAAPASPRGQFCATPLPYVPQVVGVVVAIVGTVRAERWRRLLSTAAVALGLVLGPHFVAALLPPNCADPTEAPADQCHHY